MGAVDQKLVMQVWSRCPPRGADIADGVSLDDSSARAYASRKLRQVQILRDELLAMLQDDVVAARAAFRCGDHLAVSGSQNGRPAWGGVVNAAMGHRTLVQRVFAAQVEVGADAGKFNRCTQESLLHVFAARIEITSLAVGVSV